jgi:hypothetical protein
MVAAESGRAKIDGGRGTMAGGGNVSRIFLPVPAEEEADISFSLQLDEALLSAQQGRGSMPGEATHKYDDEDLLDDYWTRRDGRLLRMCRRISSALQETFPHYRRVERRSAYSFRASTKRKGRHTTVQAPDCRQEPGAICQALMFPACSSGPLGGDDGRLGEGKLAEADVAGRLFLGALFPPSHLCSPPPLFTSYHGPESRPSPPNRLPPSHRRSSRVRFPSTLAPSDEADPLSSIADNCVRRDQDTSQNKMN